MKRVLMISGGVLPVPAVQGGAVETLIDSLISVNETEKKLQIDVVSCFHRECALHCAAGVSYHFVKYPLWVRLLDIGLYGYYEHIRHDWRSMFYRYHNRGKYYASYVAKNLPLSQYDYVVVENNMSLLPQVYETLGEQAYGEKCIYHMHSALVNQPDMLPYLQKCRCIFTLSNFVTRTLKSLPELVETSVVKVTNGVKAELPPPQERCDLLRRLRQKYHIRDEQTVFLYSGRISPEKGVLELVRAFREAAIPDSVLLVCGCVTSGSQSQNSYSKRVLRAAEDAPVIFTGYVDHRDIGQYYLAADVVVIPSTTDDAAPLTMIESMHYGKWIVASAVGGIPEYMVDYDGKLLVAKDDSFVTHLAAALRYSADRPLSPSERQVPFHEMYYYTDFVNALEVM